MITSKTENIPKIKENNFAVEDREVRRHLAFSMFKSLCVPQIVPIPKKKAKNAPVIICELNSVYGSVHP